MIKMGTDIRKLKVRYSMKKYLWLFLAMVMLIFIWGNSLEQAATSKAVSGILTGIVANVLQFLHIHVEFFVLHHLVRKLAHFTEFTILGVFVYKALYVFKVAKGLTTAVVIGFLSAVVDETIQVFIPGRSSQVSDVVLDSCGVLVGVLIIYWFTKRTRD